MKLSFCLSTRKLACGATGVIIQSCDSSSKLDDMARSNFVFELSRCDKSKAVEREACNCAELEIIQARVIPRSYGLFEPSLSGFYL